MDYFYPFKYFSIQILSKDFFIKPEIMASCSSDSYVKKTKKICNEIDEFKRQPFVKEFKNEDRPVISDDRMFSEESRTCNLLTYLRPPHSKNIYFDELYILMFLQRRRNERNRAFMRSYKTVVDSDHKYEKISRLLHRNFEIDERGKISKMWNTFRNSDYILAEQIIAKSGLSFKLSKAIVLPCYMGKVYSGDTSRAHTVLFVIYTGKKNRQIWMYDSMIKQIEEKIPRYDFNIEKDPIEFLFKEEESNIYIATQKNFHLLESFAHCLELAYLKRYKEMVNNEKAGKRKKIPYFSKEKDFYKPPQYTFIRTGFSERIVQEYDNCSSFVSWGMCSFLKNWINQSTPHRMNLSCYSQLNDRPMITTNQYICAALNIFILRNIIYFKTGRGNSLNINILTTSNIPDDLVLVDEIHTSIHRIADINLKYLRSDNIFINKINLTSYDNSSKKDLVILVFDRTFFDDKKIHEITCLLKNIHKSTAHIAVIYPDQIIHFMRINVIKDHHLIITDECQKITFALPSWASELKRARDFISPILTSFPEFISQDHDKNSFVVQLPPSGTMFLQKGIDCGFIPFRIRQQT